ncbi:MAG: right-handed parallel beta-helix repeat-containing protein [Leptolyngbyaceae cyanobacterium MO_188.B28]|nr:right-handed parallel beta-helix repeat-containing protein [Leptolyngbyaceae cyanobacterium MO_188.B28]
MRQRRQIRYRGGPTYARGAGYHQIRRNVISDNGCCGIAGWKQTGTAIIGNRIERNNRLGWTAPETGGIKVHKFIDGRIEGNLLRDNDAFGIWLDNVYRNSRVSRNVLVNNQGAGIFVEMGGGPILVDNNAIAYTRLGDGIYTHDASGVTLAHNLLYANTHFGVYMRTVSDRQFTNAAGEREPVSTSHQRIYNNVFVDNYRGHISLPLPSEQAFDNQSDYNLLINGTQWRWEGLGFNRFVLNTSEGRIDQTQLTNAFRKALDSRQVPAEQRPNLNTWADQPYLTLDLWRMITGNDEHSVSPEIHTGDVENGAIAKRSINFAARGLFLELSSDAPFQRLHPPPVAGVDQDFWGQPIPTDSLVAGPFQTLLGEDIRLNLWPVPTQ